jgi:hypothetical protein
MKRNYLQIFAVTLGFTACAVATSLVLAIPAVEQALGLSAWANNGYDGGLAYLLIAACSGLCVDLLRFAATHIRIPQPEAYKETVDLTRQKLA